MQSEQSLGQLRERCNGQQRQQASSVPGQSSDKTPKTPTAANSHCSWSSFEQHSSTTLDAWTLQIARPYLDFLDFMEGGRSARLRRSAWQILSTCETGPLHELWDNWLWEHLGSANVSTVYRPDNQHGPPWTITTGCLKSKKLPCAARRRERPPLEHRAPSSELALPSQTLKCFVSCTSRSHRVKAPPSRSRPHRASHADPIAAKVTYEVILSDPSCRRDKEVGTLKNSKPAEHRILQQCVPFAARSG